MADVTLRIVWYRMGEGYSNLADGYDRFLDWYSDFSWKRVDLLDMLFLGWLLAAFVVVGAINLYLRFFGLPKSRRAINGDISRPVGPVSLSHGETCQWLNSALSWLYLHYNTTPELVDAWIRSLNEQARKHNNGLQIKFERVQSGSLPPKVTRITTDPASKDTLSLHAGVEASDLTLMVSAMENTPTNLKVTSCDVTLSKLAGQLHIHGDYSRPQETVQLTLQFVAPPDLKLSVNTRNYDTSLDKQEIERVVRESIRGAVTSVNLSSYGGYPNYNTPSPGQNDFISATSRNTVAAGRTTPQERRLLVKVIKANGLGDKDFGCTDPFCIVEMDNPHQTHTTSVVKNTVNPFWDEHFLFDFGNASKQVKFEVFDREKPSGDDFLGRATIAMDELCRLPSTRQIIPLTGRPRATTTTSGSVTIEFVFVDATEAANMGLAPTPSDSISPRRRIETNTRITPGGALVTTTTTTTEKSRDHRVEPYYNDSPQRIERPDNMGRPGEYSPYNRGSQLEAHDAALSHSPENEFYKEDTSLDLLEASTLPRGATSGMYQDGAQYGPSGPTLTVTRPDRMGTHDISGSSREDIGEPTRAGRDTSLANTMESSKEKKKSWFKKRFSRPKKRSQSADRAYSSSFKDPSLLKPPNYSDHGSHSKTAEDLDRGMMQGGDLRKARSNSFSSSLKRIFKKKKKDGTSRESSLSHGGGTGMDVSREGSVTHPSPHMSYRDEYETDYQHDYNYSSSMPPPTSPLSQPH